jgi:hypothetical protein
MSDFNIDTNQYDMVPPETESGLNIDFGFGGIANENIQKPDSDIISRDKKEPNNNSDLW